MERGETETITYYLGGRSGVVARREGAAFGAKGTTSSHLGKQLFDDRVRTGRGWEMPGWSRTEPYGSRRPRDQPSRNVNERKRLSV